MIEDGMIRLYNKSNERVTKVIRGVRITIPAHGSANVSERKGREMMDSFPDALTEDSAYERHTYTDEDLMLIEQLDLEACRACLQVIMSGNRPDLQKAVEDSLGRQAQQENAKKR